MKPRSCAKSIQQIAIIVAIMITIAGGLVFISSAPTNFQVALAQEEQQQQQVTSNNATMVEAGGSDAQWDDFVPQSIEINAGDSVTWQNPSPVLEPHTITFMTNDTLLPPLAAPFAVSNSTALQPLIPNANVEPLIVPLPQPNQQQLPSNGSSSSQNNTITVMIDNARAYSPVVIDSTGQNVTYLPPNTSYTMAGSESYVNSGFLFPAEQLPPGVPPTTMFTVTFENPGTYDYLCALHPWMTGNVIVR
jgi:plastocyanin